MKHGLVLVLAAALVLAALGQISLGTMWAASPARQERPTIPPERPTLAPTEEIVEEPEEPEEPDEPEEPEEPEEQPAGEETGEEMPAEENVDAVADETVEPETDAGPGDGAAANAPASQPTVRLPRAGAGSLPTWLLVFGGAALCGAGYAALRRARR